MTSPYTLREWYDEKDIALQLGSAANSLDIHQQTAALDVAVRCPATTNSSSRQG